ncbi:MAG TPA: hypothetical protein VFL53_15510 [Pseudolabrys sp.]|nr:hypothetical protein [Pseudolabrys sp.]
MRIDDHNMIIQISALWLIFYAIVLLGALFEPPAVSSSEVMPRDKNISGAVAAWK